ncbi:MAG: hypothetical protein FWG70_11405 [Oscillospiraceae bacterium]|nr:hypothetical protein [Oscillospiraceae bacterium]
MIASGFEFDKPLAIDFANMGVNLGRCNALFIESVIINILRKRNYKTP